MGAKLINGARATESDHIPILDLCNLDSSNPQKRRELAQSFYDACTKNHGVSGSLISGVHGAAKKFFSLPEEEKMKVFIGDSKKFRGYSPIGGERSTGTDDDPVPEGEESGVLSEAFDIGYEIAMESQTSEEYSRPQDTYDLNGDNQWPANETLPGFSETYIQYCTAVLELC